MILILESTDQLVDVDGVERRLWKGQTALGVPVHVFVHRISPQTLKPNHLRQFETDLVEKDWPKTLTERLEPVGDPRFASVSRQNLEEAADSLFDALHAIVYATGVNRSYENCRELAIFALGASCKLSFDPTRPPPDRRPLGSDRTPSSEAVS